MWVQVKVPVENMLGKENEGIKVIREYRESLSDTNPYLSYGPYSRKLQRKNQEKNPF